MTGTIEDKVAKEVRFALEQADGTDSPPTIVLGGDTNAYRAERIAMMRDLLKSPEWIEVVDGDLTFKCLAVTEPDINMTLAYCPEKGEYCVVLGDHPPYTTIGIWGDPIGCFVAM